MLVQEFIHDRSMILLAPGVHFDPNWFEPIFLKEQRLLIATKSGRNSAYLFRAADTQCVMKHYFRGGRMRALSRDRYMWLGKSRCRSFREWSLLNKLIEYGLPVPRPLAARVIRFGLTYTADIITFAVNDAQSLSELLMTKPYSHQAWRELGRIIRKFHDYNVWHADLNAHNVLVSPDGVVHLIDFDKSELRKSAAKWKQDNLNRLLRSLIKLKKLNTQFYFSDKDFSYLLEGYQETG